MKPLGLTLFVIVLLYALVLFVVMTYGSLPPGMHLATEVRVARVDTLWKPLEVRQATRALDSLDSLWKTKGLFDRDRESLLRGYGSLRVMDSLRRVDSLKRGRK